jgi:hypothetical protein
MAAGGAAGEGAKSMTLLQSLAGGYLKQLQAKSGPAIHLVQELLQEAEKELESFWENMPHEEQLAALQSVFPKRTPAQIESLTKAIALAQKVEFIIQSEVPKLLGK